MASNIVDLKNGNNHKNRIGFQLDDILDSEKTFNEPEEPNEPKPDNNLDSDGEVESKIPGSEPAEPVHGEEYDDVDPADKLFEQNSATIDKSDAFQNNSGNMAPFTTLAGLAWESPDKHYELISHAWRKAIIVILVAMAFLAFFWQGSVLTAVTFFAIAFVTSMHFWQEARQERYEIHPHGIVAGGKFYHFHDLDSFWIHFHPQGYHELSLCTGRLLNHYIKVPLKDQDPFEIRGALLNYLPEERHEEGLDDWLRRKLGL